MVSVASHELCPTSFETSKIYSPPSLFWVLIIFNTELVSLLCTLYLWPEVSSLPAFSHLTFKGFVPENLASRVAGSPWVTLIDFTSSVIFAGSGVSKKNKQNTVSKELKASYTTTHQRETKNLSLQNTKDSTVVFGSCQLTRLHSCNFKHEWVWKPCEKKYTFF